MVKWTRITIPQTTLSPNIVTVLVGISNHLHLHPGLLLLHLSLHPEVCEWQDKPLLTMKAK
jgi:hypothetical protein